MANTHGFRGHRPSNGTVRSAIFAEAAYTDLKKETQFRVISVTEGGKNGDSKMRLLLKK